MAINTNTKKMMVTAMLSHALEKERQALQNDWHAFGMKVYCDVFDETLRKQLSSIPTGFLNLHSSIMVKIGEKVPSLAIGARVAGNRDQPYSVQKDYGHHHEFCAEFDELEQRQKDYNGKRDVLKAQISAIINGVTSFSKLWKVWPECRPVLEHFDEVSPMPIAVVMPELNAACGLPVEQGGAA